MERLLNVVDLSQVSHLVKKREGGTWKVTGWVFCLSPWSKIITELLPLILPAWGLRSWRRGNVSYEAKNSDGEGGGVLPKSARKKMKKHLDDWENLVFSVVIVLCWVLGLELLSALVLQQCLLWKNQYSGSTSQPGWGAVLHLHNYYTASVFNISVPWLQKLTGYRKIKRQHFPKTQSGGLPGLRAIQ